MSVGKRIYLKREMPDPEIMEQFKTIPASNTADVMGRSCAMNPRIRLVSKPSAQMMVGPAYTVKCRAGDNLTLHAALNFCNEGDALWTMTDEECAAFAQKELVSMGVIEPDAVRDFHRERVKKAYPAYFDTYAQIDTLQNWLCGIENLYCIGRNGQHRYNNMDHSMVTAMRAVDCITGKLADRRAVWEVNTEQSYHEEKQS